MASVPYDLKQNERKTASNPTFIAAIGGDNPTPFYLNFPNLPTGRQWIFPYTYAFMIPIDPPLAGVLLDASLIPPGYPPPPASTAQALLTAYDTSQPASPGVRSAASPPVTQASASGQLVNSGDTLSIPCGGASFVGITFGGGSLVASSTLQFQGSGDDVNFFRIPSFVIDTLVTDSPPTHAWGFGTPASANDIFGPYNLSQVTVILATGGLSQVRIRLDTAGAGQAALTITMRATPTSSNPQSFGQHLMQASQPVAIASDQTAVPVTTGPPQGLKYARATGNVPANGGSLAFIAGVAGQIITVYDVALTLYSLGGPSSTIRITDAVLSLEALTLPSDLKGNYTKEWDGGMAFSSGGALAIINDSNAIAGVWANVSYTQK